jgi:hypothetical protein
MVKRAVTCRVFISGYHMLVVIFFALVTLFFEIFNLYLFFSGLLTLVLDLGGYFVLI